ncbi:hypothetical protein RUND412_001934 [Rhizina undulata]
MSSIDDGNGPGILLGPMDFFLLVLSLGAFAFLISFLSWKILIDSKARRTRDELSRTSEPAAHVDVERHGDSGGIGKRIGSLGRLCIHFTLPGKSQNPDANNVNVNDREFEHVEWIGVAVTQPTPAHLACNTTEGHLGIDSANVGHGDARRVEALV